MKIGFTTLGCPDWDLDTICAKGSEYGFDGIDLRGYLDTLDVTLLPEFTADAADTKRKLAEGDKMAGRHGNNARSRSRTLWRARTCASLAAETLTRLATKQLLTSVGTV